MFAWSKKNTQFQTPFAENVKTLPDFRPKWFNQIQPKGWGGGATKGGGAKTTPFGSSLTYIA